MLAGVKHFYFDNEKPKFSLYWTRNPTKYQVWPRTCMTPKDRYVLSYLDRLLKKLPSRKIVGVFGRLIPEILYLVCIP